MHLLSNFSLEHPEVSEGWYLQKHKHSETVLVRKCRSKSCRYGPPPVVLFPGMQCLNAGGVEEFLDPNFGWALRLNQAIVWSSICILVQWGLVRVVCHVCTHIYNHIYIVYIYMMIIYIYIIYYIYYIIYTYIYIYLCSRVSFSTALGAVAPATLGRLAVGRSGE